MCGEGPGGQFCFKNLPLSLRNMSVNLSIFFVVSGNVVVRIMDCFLCDGIEIIFRVALTLLTMGKHELLLLDIEGVIKVD